MCTVTPLGAVNRTYAGFMLFRQPFIVIRVCDLAPRPLASMLIYVSPIHFAGELLDAAAGSCAS